MLDALAVFGELLGLTAALVALGEPLRLLAAKVSVFFRDLNFIEICVLDLYIGGLILYALALLPLGLFDVPIIVSLLLVFLTISLIYHWGSRREFHISVKRNESSRNQKIEYAIVFALFFMLLCVQVFPLFPVIYGSVHDVSLHSLFSQAIIDNRYLASTLAPYSKEGAIYPEASHVIFAFAADLTGWAVPQAIFYLTMLFNAVAVLAAYMFARKVWLNRSFSLGIAFVFAFVSSWPLFVTWGANPFVAGFPLFLICLGALFEIFLNPEKENWKGLLVVGLLFGYLGAIIVSFLQTLMAMSIIWLLIQFFRRSINKKLFLGFVFLFSVSILPMGPFIYRFVSYYPYPGHNLGIPTDFIGYEATKQSLLEGAQWAVVNLSAYPYLRGEVIAICIISVLLFFVVEKQKRLGRPFLMALLILAASTALSLVSYALPADFTVVSWGHQGIILAVALSLLASLFGHHFFAFLLNVGPKFFRDDPKKPQATLMISIIAVSAIFAPFVYARLVLDPWTLKGAYDLFAITYPQDSELMLWMRENLTHDAVVLVNPYEAGLFIPAVSYRETIFTTLGSQLSRRYQELFASLCNQTLNVTCYDEMKSFNITHVYVGSVATYWWVKNYKWLPQLFLGNPNFQLVKRIDQAYLFKVLYKDPSLVFQDDFEHDHWSDYGWRTNYDGNGLGNVTIAKDFDNNTQKCLEITAQAVYTASTWKYTRYAVRQVFVQNNSKVQFSFNFKATEGFHGSDTFAAIVSNIYGNQSIVMSTPNGVYENYANSISLGKSEGFWSSNLTALWNQRFHSLFPASFLLEFINYDLDGIENVAYVDNVNVTAVPIT